MEINVKVLRDNAILPTYATDGSACFDIYSTEIGRVFPNHHSVFRTGLAFEIPEGYCLKIYSRSGQGFAHDIRLANCVGIIDSDYRGELMVKLASDSNHAHYEVKPGDRIAQGELVPVIKAQFKIAEDLTKTARGESGFGSTGT